MPRPAYDEGMETAAERVTIARTSPKDVQQRQVIVTIDDGDKLQLLFGESATLEIAPGAHVLKAHNTLVRRQMAFDVAPGEHVQFLVSNQASRWMFGFLVVMGVAPLNLIVERLPAAPAISKPP